MVWRACALVIALAANAARADDPPPVAVHGLIQAAASYVAHPYDPAVDRHELGLDFAGLQLDATPNEITHGSLLVDFSRGRTTLLDAYLEIRLGCAVTLRLGRAQLPITEERNTPRLELLWFATSPAAWLTPARGVGVFASGDIPGAAHWNLAFVASTAPGVQSDIAVEAGHDVIARIFSHAVLGASVGIGASFGEHQGTTTTPQTLVIASYGGQALFAYRGTVLATGGVLRIAPHATWTWGTVAAYADVVFDRSHVDDVAITSEAASATVTMAVTGETASPLRRVRVRRDLRQGGVGAIQLVFGGGWWNIANGAFPVLADPARAASSALVIGGGVNWYPIDRLGVLVDYSRTRSQRGDGAQPTEHAVNAVVELRL